MSDTVSLARSRKPANAKSVARPSGRLRNLRTEPLESKNSPAAVKLEMSRLGSESRISSKGQITLPADVRKRLGVKGGDCVRFTFEEGQTVVRPSRPAANPLDKWVGTGKGVFRDEAELLAWERDMRGYDAWDEADLSK